MLLVSVYCFSREESFRWSCFDVAFLSRPTSRSSCHFELFHLFTWPIKGTLLLRKDLSHSIIHLRPDSGPGSNESLNLGLGCVSTKNFFNRGTLVFMEKCYVYIRFRWRIGIKLCASKPLSKLKNWLLKCVFARRAITFVPDVSRKKFKSKCWIFALRGDLCINLLRSCRVVFVVPQVAENNKKTTEMSIRFQRQRYFEKKDGKKPSQLERCDLAKRRAEKM